MCFWNCVCSGQDHTATHRRVVATQQLGSLNQILAFMDCGLITTMAPTPLTVTLPTLLTNLRYVPTFFLNHFYPYKNVNFWAFLFTSSLTLELPHKLHKAEANCLLCLRSAGSALRVIGCAASNDLCFSGGNSFSHRTSC